MWAWRGVSMVWAWCQRSVSLARTTIAAIPHAGVLRLRDDFRWPAWAAAPTVLAWMKTMNYTDAVDVYHYYERRIISIVRSLGKKTYAWEDIDGACGFGGLPWLVFTHNTARHFHATTQPHIHSTAQAYNASYSCNRWRMTACLFTGFSMPHWNGTQQNSYNAYQDVTLSVWAGWIGNGRNWQVLWIPFRLLCRTLCHRRPVDRSFCVFHRMLSNTTPA